MDQPGEFGESGDLEELQAARIFSSTRRLELCSKLSRPHDCVSIIAAGGSAEKSFWSYALLWDLFMNQALSVSLNDEDLFLRLTNFEDNFVERKRFSDDREWLRTVVAFANSCPVGFPGVLFIGVRDDGDIERLKNQTNLDSLQKTLTERINEAWPPVYVLPRVLQKDGYQFLAVLIPGSPSRPHFAGHSYIRIGSETRKASEPQFNELIAQRLAKPFEIQKWKGQFITVERMYSGRSGRYPFVGKVVECNSFYVTVLNGEEPISFPYRKRKSPTTTKNGD